MLRRMIRRIPVIARSLLGRKPNAPDLLTRQHMRVETFLALCKAARDEARRRALFFQIKSDLTVHAEIEEKIFYPASAQYENLAPQVDDFYKEHQKMKELLDEMTKIPTTDRLFDRRLNELSTLINRHVDEEESELFPRVRRLMGKSQLRRLGDAMREYQRARVSAQAE
jgi:hemerythrin superfamily protein